MNDKREKRRSEKRERDRRESEKTRDDSDSNMSNPTTDVVPPLQNGPGIAAAASNMWGGMMGRYFRQTEHTIFCAEKHVYNLFYLFFKLLFSH